MERLLEFVEGVPALIEHQTQVAQHVGIERDRSGEEKGDTAARAEAVAEEVGAALVADATRVFGQFLVGEDKAVAQIDDRGGDDRDNRWHVAGGARAGEGDVLQRHVWRMLEKMDHAFDFVGQRLVVGRADETQLAVEGVVQMERGAHVASGYSSRMAAAQVPVKSMAETQARRGLILLPRIHGRASVSR